MKLPIPIGGSAYSDAAVAFVAARPALGEATLQIDLLNPHISRGREGEKVQELERWLAPNLG